jgi:hypothetical protein
MMRRRYSGQFFFMSAAIIAGCHAELNAAFMSTKALAVNSFFRKVGLDVMNQIVSGCFGGADFSETVLPLVEPISFSSDPFQSREDDTFKYF